MEVMNPTTALIGEMLGQIESGASERWLLASDDSPRVMVNGISAPIVRIGWRDVDAFFNSVYDEANRRFFRGRLPYCLRTWNSRFRRVAGRIDCPARHMELSSAHFEACGVGALGIVVVHEMIHLSLFVDRKPYGHTPEFKSRSEALGMPGIYHDLPLPERIERRKRVHLYRCACGQVIESRIRFRTPRACLDCCRRHTKGRYDERFRFVYVGLRDAG